MSSSCEHDERFSGMWGLESEDNGCLACAFERVSAENKKLERDNKALTICLDHAMHMRKNPDYDATEQLTSLLRELVALKNDKT